MFRLRPASLAMTLAIVVASVGGTTLAGHITSQVQSYTGCLTNGSIVQVAVGDAPMKPCKGGQVQVHFSGGDITAITAGIGLVGGGANGGVALAVAPSFQLPQNCTTQQVAKWNGTGWACAADDSTAYTAGTGLELSGSAFGISTNYRLPQGCASGDWARYRIPGGWECSDGPQASLPRGFELEQYPDEIHIPDDGTLYEVVRLELPAGRFLVSASGNVFSVSLTDQAEGVCQLRGPILSDWRRVGYQDGAEARERPSIVSIFELPAAGSVVVECMAFSSADHARARDFEIVAVEVGRP